MDGWDRFWGLFMMLLVWGVPAAVIVAAVRAFGTRSEHHAGPAEDPQEILEIRFAEGEITEEEFEERRRALAARV
jgi:uncharacterized membrane protein